VRLWHSRTGKRPNKLQDFFFLACYGSQEIPARTKRRKASQVDNTDPNHYRAWQINHKDQPFPAVSSYPNEDALIADVKKAVAQGTEKAGKAPRVLIIGALGRCGTGAVDLCLRAGVPTESILKWDLAETGNET
jgi:hypothetical protein